jgi:AraC-like DNA-binding protein
MSAKSFLRIERVWAAHHAIRAGTPLAQAAAELGFADQAHLSREVKALLGVSPRSLRAVGNLQDLASPAR